MRMRMKIEDEEEEDDDEEDEGGGVQTSSLASEIRFVKAVPHPICLRLQLDGLCVRCAALFEPRGVGTNT